uniref:Protein FAM19A5 n=1 Tax=Macaca mulatta TaxID=9544 RepID=A0A5F7ZQN0_MACMU
RVATHLLLLLSAGQLAAGTCEIVTLDRDSSQPRRTIARQTARCACRKGQIAGTTRARPACVDGSPGLLLSETSRRAQLLPCPGSLPPLKPSPSLHWAASSALCPPGARGFYPATGKGLGAAAASSQGVGTVERELASVWGGSLNVHTEGTWSGGRSQAPHRPGDSLPGSQVAPGTIRMCS